MTVGAIAGSGPFGATSGQWLGDGGESGGDGGVGWQFAQQVPWQVWLVAFGVLLLLLLSVVLWLRHLWRRARRRGLLRPDRIEGGLLALQASVLPDGPAHDATVLRRRLAGELADTRAALAAAASAAPVGGLPAVLVRLTAAAADVDGQLRAAQGERDPERQAAALSAAVPGAEAILAAADRIRAALATTRAALDEPELAALGRDVDDEVSALNAYTEAYRELEGGQP